METAKPTKFEKTIKEAINFIPNRPEKYKNIESKEQRFYNVEPNAEKIKTFIKQKITL